MLPSPFLKKIKKRRWSKSIFAFLSPSAVENRDDIHQHMGSPNFERGLLEGTMYESMHFALLNTRKVA
jgi:hypothetical protein